jgi:hypothetical protein
MKLLDDMTYSNQKESPGLSLSDLEKIYDSVKGADYPIQILVSSEMIELIKSLIAEVPGVKFGIPIKESRIISKDCFAIEYKDRWVIHFTDGKELLFAK